MKIESLDSFRHQIEAVMTSYYRYLKEDREECLEEGLEDYADQRQRQIEDMFRAMNVISSQIWKLKEFIE